jgi:hypothetical protein
MLGLLSPNLQVFGRAAIIHRKKLGIGNTSISN